MKIWREHGSEHSAKLQLIGRFKAASDASKASELLAELTLQAEADSESGELRIGHTQMRYSEAMRDLLVRRSINIIAPHEVEQFTYDVRSEINGEKVTISTDEIDVSAYIKVMIACGAHVELYSSHNYPTGPDESEDE